MLTVSRGLANNPLSQSPQMAMASAATTARMVPKLVSQSVIIGSRAAETASTNMGRECKDVSSSMRAN